MWFRCFTAFVFCLCCLSAQASPSAEAELLLLPDDNSGESLGTDSKAPLEYSPDQDVAVDDLSDQESLKHTNSEETNSDDEFADKDGSLEPDPLIAPEVVRTDLSNLYQSLQAAHFNLFAYRSQTEYDAYFQQLSDSVTEPMTRLEVNKLFMRFVAYGKVGHAKVNFPIPQYANYLQQGGTLIPLDIRVVGERILIARNYSTDERLKTGTELLAINGRSSPYWLNRTLEYVSAERSYMAYAQLESMFPRLMWLVTGQQDEYELIIRTEAGNETVAVKAVPVMTVEEYKASMEETFYDREASMLSSKIAYLRPGPFYSTDDIGDLGGFESFIRDAFTAFIQRGAEELILDLRNNPGGDNSFSDPMIAWFADQPFHFASRYEVKASPQTRTVLASLAEQYPYGLSAQMAKRIEEYRDGEVFEFEIPENAPRNQRFTGRVWALIDRHTYSNAATVAAIIQDYGFGVLAGQETSDLPTSYASSAQFILPETGIEVTYPKAFFVRPNGSEALSGVVPDRIIELPMVDELTARADDWDLVLEALRAMIEAERSKTPSS